MSLKKFNLSKYSLSTTVSTAVIIIVVCSLAINTLYHYYSTKQTLVKKMKEESQLTVLSIEKSLSSLMKSYSVHEYEDLIQNQMRRSDILAIVVEDSQMGKILGRPYLISGYIRDQKGGISEYNPEVDFNFLKHAAYVHTHHITCTDGIELGNIHIYISSDRINKELNLILFVDIINAFFISSLLILSLMGLLRKIFLNPISSITDQISKTDAEGIPLNPLIPAGSKEIITLSETINKMMNAIRDVNSILNQQQQELINSESQLLLILNLSPIAVRIATQKGRKVVFVNKAYEALMEKSLDQIIDLNPENFYKNPDQYRAILQRIENDEEIYNELVELIINEKTVWVLASYMLITFHGEVGLLGWFFDVTEQKNHEEKLQHVAYHDLLTNLPNRGLLSKLIPRIFARIKRQHMYAALLFIDLDGFKKVNDIYGHQAGDALLKEISSRMYALLREDDLIARIGGDEFVVLISDLVYRDDVIPLIKRILECISTPYRYESSELMVSASIGVSFYPQQCEVDTDSLLRQADQAMYEAKMRGKNQYAYFEEISDLNETDTHINAENIGNGFHNGEFTLHYQPKVNMYSGEILGAEALIRWNHPFSGLLYPDQFLPLIENRPLLLELDKWVLHHALAQLSTWNYGGFFTTLSINISAYTFKKSSFIDIIDEGLSTYPSVKPQQIEIEILETSALHDINEIQRVITALHQKGISIALDDFGTGYSTLSYLKQLEVNYLKLDKSFVLEMKSDPSNLRILEATLGLADAFNAKVIAEGVESDEHAKLLIQFGCDLGQGFGIARPMPSEQFLLWKSQWKPHPSWGSTQKISPTLFPVVYAGLDHLKWFNRFKTKEHLTANELPTHCRFGLWLQKEGRHYFDEMEFQEIDTLHVAFHDTIDLLLKTETAKYTEVWNKTNHLHEKIMETLNAKALSGVYYD
jgi:diguanylate cyclase (GGDEF)-like protein/PAS domain S-box-containing protein